MRVLVDLRPAFAGHAGIPQETRLLFAGLLGIDGAEVTGLLQSSNRVLARGFDGAARPGADAQRQAEIGRRVMATLDGATPSRARRLARAAAEWSATALQAAAGRDLRLTTFDPLGVEERLWQALFERTLPRAGFDAVTRSPYRVLRLPWSVAHAGALATARLGHAFYPRLDTRGFDVLIAQTPYPGRVSAGTQLVVRYHDTVPLRMAATTRWPSYDRAIHRLALQRNHADGAWFACVSAATRRDLLALEPGLEPRTVTIPNLLSPQYHADDSEPAQVVAILRARARRSLGAAAGSPARRDPSADAAGGQPMPAYLLMVSTLEPRKNHLALLDAWERLRATTAPGLQLVLVGALGWQHDAIVARLSRGWSEGQLHLLGDVPAAELRVLYRHAAVTVCPSTGEGFGYSGVEAMACGGIVVASDIAAHREVYGDAADFFDPASSEALAAALRPWLAPVSPPLRARRVDAGGRVADRYRGPAVLPRWDAFLRRLVEDGVRPRPAPPPCPAA